jgi:hypothetical protein
LVAIERCRLLRTPGRVKRKQDIDSQPQRRPLDPIEITWTEKRLVLTSPQQGRLFHSQPEHLRRRLENQTNPHRAHHNPPRHPRIHA